MVIFISQLFINNIKDSIKGKLKEFIGRKQPLTDEEGEDIIDKAIEDWGWDKEKEIKQQQHMMIL